MTRRLYCSVGQLALAALLLAYCDSPAAARTWRIGVGGGRVIGYTGALAKYGLPRQRMTDEELTDPQALAGYDVVIIAYPCSVPQPASAAIEEYVKNGGLAITECRVMPSASALAGERLGPAPAPNITFAGYDHPISKPLVNAGVLVTYARPGSAIIPAEGANAAVLAAFTDEGVNKKYRGKLTGGKKGIPALVLFEHGEGQWLYCGSGLGFSLALRGPELEPWLLATLSHFSDGELTPRFVSLATDQWLLPSVPLRPPAEPESLRRPPRDEQPADLAEGYEVFDLDGDGLTSFDLVGQLPAGAAAEVMLSWLNGSWQRQLEITTASVSLMKVTKGRANTLRQVPRPPSPEGGSQVLVKRRPGSVTVFFDGRAVLLGAVDNLEGKVASRGLSEVNCQPTAPVYFHDDFMRAQGEPNPWETPNGAWELHKVEGAAAQGANPFAFAGKGDASSSALAGYWFWDDYEYSVSARATADAVGMYAHYRAPDDYLLLRLEYPPKAGKPGLVSVVRRSPTGQRTLAEAPADCEPDKWYRLGVRVSGGHLIATLDGETVAQVAGEATRGWGQVGLYVEWGRALFDDVEVLPWRVLPLPVGEDGPWAWEVQRGRCNASRDGLRVQPHGFARLLSAWPGAHDMLASAQVRLAAAGEAGLLLRYQSPRDHYLLCLKRAGRAVVLRLVRTVKGEEQVLAQQRVTASPARWHQLAAALRGERIVASLDGDRLFEVSDAAVAHGRLGLFCADKRAADFRLVRAMPARADGNATDPPPPPYAGIIDRHTWAGRGSSWVPRPEDLDLFWHRGLFIGPLTARLGAHPDANGRTAASVVLGDGVAIASGYCLAADQPAPGQPIAVRLLRSGQEVGSATARPAAHKGFVLDLCRAGDLLLGHIDGRPVVSYHDPAPLEGAVRVGFRRDAATVDPADAEIISPGVRTYTFTRAPADWHPLSGAWEISNRWSCSPDWTWLAGWHKSEEARIRTKRRYLGDQQTDIYLAAKMMPAGEKKFYEQLRDIHAGLCEDGQGGGYRVVVGGNDNTYCCIQRNGQPVAENKSYRIPTSGLHNNWLLLTLVKRGNVVCVLVWDHEILRYEDPEPIEGGYISLGTHHNGIVVPRVSIYAQPDEASATRKSPHPDASPNDAWDSLPWLVP